MYTNYVVPHLKEDISHNNLLKAILLQDVNYHTEFKFLNLKRENFMNCLSR